MNSRRDYWEEAVSVAFDDAGAYELYKQLTEEQRNLIASTLEGASETQGMAFCTPESYENIELKNIKVELAKEREKVFCQVCSGTGRQAYASGVWDVNSQCYRCRGEGKHKP